MKVRLRDWASLNCITERTVQIHIKENQEALEGHTEGLFMLTLDVIELNQKENIAMMNKINKLELIHMTAAERQQFFEKLCTLPEPEFREHFEHTTDWVFCYHCVYRKDTTGNGHICGYDNLSLLMPKDGYCRHGVKSNN